MSVNDGVEKDICSLSYTSVDVVADKALALRRGVMLAKMDIKQAYIRKFLIRGQTIKSPSGVVGGAIH